MSRYLPGAILAVCGVLVYGIGCALFLAQRRQRGREGASKSLYFYAIALGVGLLALEAAQYQALNG